MGEEVIKGGDRGFNGDFLRGGGEEEKVVRV